MLLSLMYNSIAATALNRPQLLGFEVLGERVPELRASSAFVESMSRPSPRCSEPRSDNVVVYPRMMSELPAWCGCRED